MNIDQKIDSQPVDLDKFDEEGGSFWRNRTRRKLLTGATIGEEL